VKLYRIILWYIFTIIVLSCNSKDNSFEKTITITNTDILQEERQTNQTMQSSTTEKQTISIMSFNIQIFGASKMAKQEVVSILTDIVSQYDLIAIQEVRSVSIDPVLQFMDLLSRKYKYILGPREGRTNSKEQYWTIYNSERLIVIEYESWPDINDKYERNPMGIYFKTISNFDFILINNHIQPSDALSEINTLTEVITYFKDLWKENDVLIVGDFNSDGQYFNESLLYEVFPEDEYTIIITNEYDTTVAESDNTYDRFIITSSAIEDYTGNFGIVRFDEIFDFSSLNILPKQVSDHYPIWAEYYIDNDTD
jgi:endonuclease/exonuclease/phosphatase family metal-dependent hydrolase